MGTIARGWSGCATSFSIAFPDGSLLIQKASLLACTMLIDFLTGEHRSEGEM